jgi:hypothetical protein
MEKNEFNINDLISKEEIEKFNNAKKFDGGDYWYIPFGESIVRLLPRLESKIPWKIVKIHRHNYNGNQITGNCPKSFGHKFCPVCSVGWEWKTSGDEALQEKSIQLYAKSRFLYNVYIVDDIENPNNNGKIKVMSVGKKLHELIQGYFNDEDYGVNIFSPYEEFNFVIKKKQDDNGYPSYSGSRFAPKLTAIDLKWKELQKQLINLDELVVEETPETIKKKFFFLFKDEIERTPKIEDEAEDTADDVADELDELLKDEDEDE